MFGADLKVPRVSASVSGPEIVLRPDVSSGTLAKGGPTCLAGVDCQLGFSV